ncbi:MAG: gliding motility-associated ABC transporter substrate-binding protein GldG [Bacteroidales bacterium]|nr:gliding motility-associated ABC transporter substrate-binding protein GldG [Bacteroidales bacterium]
MFTLFRKEIAGFFSSLTGYIVMIVFLLANSLIMWIMPGQWNLLDSGYAGLDTLFVLSPWIFLFLVPAVTMRLFSEERRSGTMELLWSRPVGDGAVIYGKFLASVALVLLALLPCLVFAVSVWVLGETPGNLDRGGTAGSFIGLLMLAAVYSAIGLFASSLTENQVIAFIIAAVISFIMFTGFDSLSLVPGLSSIGEEVSAMGINEHYKSISRGVLDIRDVAYFVFVTVLFNETARLTLRRSSWKKPLAIVTAVAAVSILISLVHIRVDLTEDRRFTLAEPTKKILRDLDREVKVDIFLDGEMPVGFRKLRRSASQYLDEFRVTSGRKVSYDFINPSGSSDRAERENYHNLLISRGLMPVNVMASDGEGGRTQKKIFPSLTVTCGETVIPVNFLRNNPSLPAETNLLHSTEGLEYEIIQAIATATADTIHTVAFIEGHGELEEAYVADLTLELAKFYNIDRGVIGGRPGIIDRYAAIIIAAPERAFDEKDKFIIDQYIMNGGRVMWLAEEVKVDADSLTAGSTVALYEPLSFSDMLFRYGARINPVIIQDAECMLIPLKVTNPGGEAQYVPVPWIYYPLLRPSDGHPVTRNLNRVKAEFAGTVDTVGRDPGIKKSVLLTTSGQTRTVTPPLVISLEEADEMPPREMFTAGALPVAVLLEGTFHSVFTNRMTESLMGEAGRTILTESKPTKMIVVADGDIIRNEVSWQGGVAEPLTLGLDRYTMQTFGNKDFLVNSINYLVHDNGLIEMRSREIKPRLLDQARIKSQRTMWQLVNTLVPVIIIILAGIAYNRLKRRHYISVK